MNLFDRQKAVEKLIYFTRVAVKDDRRSNGGDMIQHDMKSLIEEDFGDRTNWRRRIRVADPSPGRD